MARTRTFNAVLSTIFALRTHAVMCAIALAGTASPALAESETSTKLVRCGAESCLRVSGYRDDPASVVRINGYEVAVEGKRRWQVQLPVEVVRQWSEPDARTIEVSLHGLGSQLGASDSVDLPVGMLSRMTDLSALVITVY